jgi:hypothetical protein
VTADDLMIEAIAEAVALKLERMAGMQQCLMEIEDAAKYLGMTVHALRHKAGSRSRACGSTASCALIAAIWTAGSTLRNGKEYRNPHGERRARHRQTLPAG